MVTATVRSTSDSLFGQASGRSYKAQENSMNFDSEFFSERVAVAQQESTASTVSHSITASGELDLTETKDVREAILPQSPLTSDSYSGAFSDFYGFPSHPISVYRTGDEWPVPKGPQAQRVPREARPICNHPIRAVWRTLGEFPDIEIAFRESVFTRSAGPQLLNNVFSVHPTADIRSPFTGTLGVQIAARQTSYFEGTDVLYLCEGGQSNRVFLLTARHVLFPPSVHDNKLYELKKTSEPRHEVLILGSKAYQDALKGMMAKIRREVIFVNHYKRELAALGEVVEGEDATVAEVRQEFEDKLAEAEKTITAVEEFHGNIKQKWSLASERVLGHVVYAPPISVVTGPKQFTEDWALIELNRDKINWNDFKGNVVYLGTMISAPDFVLKMHPHPEGQSSFKYPVGGLLQVKGVVKEEEIHQPTSLDANGEECIIVIKNSLRTGVTVGRGACIESFVREYHDSGIKSTSMEMAIYPYSHKDGAFSAPGDSGSIVVDGLGRIVGMLTSGTGTTHSTDVTYMTPYFWVEERIKMNFPHSYLYPIKK